MCPDARTKALRKDEKGQKSKARRAEHRPAPRSRSRFALISCQVLDFCFFEGHPICTLSSPHLIFSKPLFHNPLFFLFFSPLPSIGIVDWQDQTDLLIKPVQHLRHHLSSSILSSFVYILEGSLVDLKHQDKKGCRQLFRSYITTFPFVPPLSEYMLRLLSPLRVHSCSPIAQPTEHCTKS